MGALSVVIYTVIVIISLILVMLILLQPAKGGGLGSSFGGMGETVFGAHAMDHLAKLTVVFISLFFVLTLLLAALSGHSRDAREVKSTRAEQMEANAQAKAGEEREKMEALLKDVENKGESVPVAPVKQN